MTPHQSEDGWYDLTAALDDKVRLLSHAPPRIGDQAHPIHAYVGALGGMNIPIGDFSRALGLAFDHGPVLGKCTLSFPGRLRVGQRYKVTPRVISQKRKPSRRFGQADHLLMEITLADREGPASSLEFSMITPVAPHAK